MVVCDDLFVAIRTRRKSTVIQQIARTHPEQVRKRNPEGQLPLHYALLSKKNNSMAVIRLFVQQYPESVQERTRAGGELPMHLAAQKASQPMPALRFLAEKFPEGIRDKDHHGRLPLHHAARSINAFSLPEDAPADRIIPFLVEQFPESVQVRDNNGYLPLHDCAAASATAKLLLPYSCVLSLRNVQFLLAAFPQAIREKTQDHGYLPLHLALGVKHKGSFSVPMVRYLVEQYPEGLQEQAEDGSIPIFMVVEAAAATAVWRMAEIALSPVSQLDLIYWCVLKSPNFVYQAHNVDSMLHRSSSPLRNS